MRLAECKDRSPGTLRTELFRYWLLQFLLRSIRAKPHVPAVDALMFRVMAAGYNVAMGGPMKFQDGWQRAPPKSKEGFEWMGENLTSPKDPVKCTAFA